MIKVFYAVFVGILLAVLVTSAIQTFYALGNYPEYPAELNTASDLTPAEQTILDQYNKKVTDYTNSQDAHARISIVLALAASLILLAAGLLFTSAKFQPIHNGAIIGSVLTVYFAFLPSNYNIIASKFDFFTILGTLIVALGLGFFKFYKSEKA